MCAKKTSIQNTKLQVLPKLTTFTISNHSIGAFSSILWFLIISDFFSLFAVKSTLGSFNGWNSIFDNQHRCYKYVRLIKNMQRAKTVFFPLNTVDYRVFFHQSFVFQANQKSFFFLHQIHLFKYWMCQLFFLIADMLRNGAISEGWTEIAIVQEIANRFGFGMGFVCDSGPNSRGIKLSRAQFGLIINEFNVVRMFGCIMGQCIELCCC